MNLVTRFTGLYQSETLVDVTLAAEGKHLQVSFPKQWYFVTKIVLIYWKKIVLVIEKNF